MDDGPTRTPRSSRPPAGADPSILVLGAGAGARPIRLLRYDAETLDEVEAEEVGQLLPWLEREGIVWIDAVSPDAAQLRQLAAGLGLHPLAVADVAHPPQRPKYARYAAFELFVLAAPRGQGVEQIGLLVGQGWVLTIREPGPDPFVPVRQRLEERVGVIRERGAAWLAAALITTVVDGFLEPVELVRESIERLEDQVLLGHRRPLLRTLHRLRRRLLGLRRAVGPIRDAILLAVREESPRWDADARLHLREAGEDAAHLLETVEAAQANAVSLGDLYLSVLGSRTNEVVTFLTLISTLFLPMTFLTSLWGMNFWHMPELRWRWGYLFAWSMILLSAAGLILFFRSRGWFRSVRSGGIGGLEEPRARGARRRARRREERER